MPKVKEFGEVRQEGDDLVMRYFVFDGDPPVGEPHAAYLDCIADYLREYAERIRTRLADSATAGRSE